jgi:uncharacterized lipoprotein YajG
LIVLESIILKKYKLFLLLTGALLAGCGSQDSDSNSVSDDSQKKLDKY